MQNTRLIQKFPRLFILSILTKKSRIILKACYPFLDSKSIIIDIISENYFDKNPQMADEKIVIRGIVLYYWRQQQQPEKYVKLKLLE